MSEFMKRMITASILIIIGSLIYFYASPLSISCLLLTMLCSILWFEYRPLFKVRAFTSYCALALILCGFAALIIINQHGHRLFPLPFILATLADSGGYIVGHLTGKRAIAPTISPKKTIEGFIGSCICTTIGFLMWIYFLRASSNLEIVWNASTMAPLIAVGIACAFAGLLGDLCISKLKRNAGVKDTGSLLPGHGGLLDRLDSVLAIALLLFFL